MKNPIRGGSESLAGFRHAHSLVCSAIGAVMLVFSPACGGVSSTATSDAATARPAQTLEQRAIEADEEVANRAREVLRGQGPEGLRNLLAYFQAEVAELRTYETGSVEPRLERIRRAIDHVAGQRDAHASGLYWFTDLEAAKAQAADEGKPILSLRLLGRLDEEMSCANSRFFRIVLYPNLQVAAQLREHYVLHWSSERPAPRITIDMGDGRTIERTITGNSVHYLLDERGRPVDAWVGLYSPERFLSGIQAGRERWQACLGQEEGCIGEAHREAARQLEAEWNGLRELNSLPTLRDAIAGVLMGEVPGYDGNDEAFPTAMQTMRLTGLKSRGIEQPMLALVDRRPVSPNPATPGWVNRLARLENVEFDASTLALLRLKGALERNDAGAELQLERSLVAQDAVLNRTVFKRELHRLFEQQDWEDWEALNDTIYRELLLTPSEDPWLGLRPDSVFDGIERRP